jgi:hypothetical protein
MTVTECALSKGNPDPRERLREIESSARVLQTGHVVVEAREERVAARKVPSRET